ncbi:hypothetical protein [Paraburkholderia dinghuensis]|uniref:hypothetical protein n=1 Tax=Paraburkholderia dinghuensis TaxID=2305225 RepID=UPI001629A79B|nr:hypothetical protein [Paraburkholderia dinghuensis]
MTRNAVAVLYVLALIAVIVGVDVLFFKDRLVARLIVNIGIAAVFAAVYVLFVRRR